MHLDEISEYKTLAIEKILSNQNIVKALKYTSPDFLSKPDVIDPEEQIYETIFPFDFIPELTTTVKACVNISYDNVIQTANGYKRGVLIFSIWNHKNNFKTDFGKTRVDFIIEELDKTFNKARGFGIGELQFRELKGAVLNSTFTGYQLKYTPVEFNELNFGEKK